VTVEEIASAAGVTGGLVHHYFGGREDVYIALLQRSRHRTRWPSHPSIGQGARRMP
jgi:AcrR family transcriptional regulator